MYLHMHSSGATNTSTMCTLDDSARDVSTFGECAYLVETQILNMQSPQNFDHIYILTKINKYWGGI